MTIDATTKKEIRRRYAAKNLGTIDEIIDRYHPKIAKHKSTIKDLLTREYDDTITRDEFVRRYGDALEGIGLTVQTDFPLGEVRIYHTLPDSDEGVITEGECAGMSIEDYDSEMWRKMDSITSVGKDVCGWLVDGQSGITLYLDWDRGKFIPPRFADD